jgi:hypothetical protein
VIGVRLPDIQWLRPSGLRFPAEAPVAGEVIGFGVDAERGAGGETERCPTTLTVVAYQG